VSWFPQSGYQKDLTAGLRCRVGIFRALAWHGTAFDLSNKSNGYHGSSSLALIQTHPEIFGSRPCQIIHRDAPYYRESLIFTFSAEHSLHSPWQHSTRHGSQSYCAGLATALSSRRRWHGCQTKTSGCHGCFPLKISSLSPALPGFPPFLPHDELLLVANYDRTSHAFVLQ
jgi:hypothetical protein